jgi:hypothetical protein
MIHMMPLGRSIVEHAIRVAGGPDVYSLLEAQLSPDSCVALQVIGGHRTSDVALQL